MRFVMVEIPDNEEADQFVDAIKRGDLLISFSKDNGNGTGEYGYKSPTGAKVQAVFAVPTQFCSCPTAQREGKSKKYGWYVCTKCMKPRPGSMQHPYNLTELHKDPKEWVYYLGFRADRQGWRIPKKLP